MGRAANNNRLFVDAVLYRHRAGIPWRGLPERFGDWRLIHLPHSRWSRSGLWQRVLEALAQDADNEWAVIDSAIVRAHQHSTGAKKPGLSGHRAQPRRLEHQNPRHRVDALGNPSGFHLTLGQAHDLEGADVL